MKKIQTRVTLVMARAITPWDGAALAESVVRLFQSPLCLVCEMNKSSSGTVNGQASKRK